MSEDDPSEPSYQEEEEVYGDSEEGGLLGRRGLDSGEVADDDVGDSAPAILIDNGSGYMKAGFATDVLPTVVFPTIVGRPRRRFVELYGGQPLVGEEAMAERHHMSFSHPIDHGHIDDWIEMEEVWTHLFKRLGVENAKNNPVLLTEPPLCSQVHREHMAEIMLEVYEAPEINISCQGLMGIYATGRTTGFVLDIGEGITQCVPVFDGFTEKGSVKRSDFGGQELTMYLQKILCDIGYPMTSRDDYEHVRLIKESLCFCSLNPIEDQRSTELTQTYPLPEGVTLRDGATTEIVLGPERFYPAEALFNPQLCGRDSLPLTELIWQAIHACPLETRKTLMSNIVVSGGSSMFPGFPERLENELRNTAPSQARSSVRVIAPEDRLYLVWQGCRTFGSSRLRPLQDHCWVSRQEWEECGKNVIHKKAVLKIT
eukprot:GHVS01029637.1.p1 GENE.GHVS01029637.1~~GHVS01029637.1.p1  ORF type:complete len:441 (+),score=56.83 GHVS01029637.1:40-1323(+)